MCSYRDTCKSWTSARSHFGFNFLQVDFLVLGQVLEKLVVVVSTQLLLSETMNKSLKRIFVCLQQGRIRCQTKGRPKPTPSRTDRPTKLMKSFIIPLYELVNYLTNLRHGLQ